MNLMAYVTHVFMKLFGWEQQKARKHMLEVHKKGQSILVREGAEKAEFYVHELLRDSGRLAVNPFDGVPHQFGRAVEAQLLLDVGAVGLHRADAQMQFGGHLPGAAAMAQQTKDFQFAVA